MKTSSTRTVESYSINGLSKLGVAALGVAFSILSASEVLGQTPISATTPDPAGVISVERLRAQKLFQAVTAVRVPIDDARLIQMETLLRSGNARGAVAVATADPLFLDVQVRDIARKMSTREESVRAPMSDFVATFIGVVRDSDTVSAKALLTGNFYYRVDPAVATTSTIRQAEMADIIQSNNHYNDLTARNLSPAAVLVQQTPQRAVQGGAAVNHPSPAGLITTRGFTEAHAIAGTNRRMVEYTFRQFMCVGMSDWADASAADERVAQDVTRTPSGSVNLYLTTCKSCHSVMDGFRGAFAYLDFTNNAQTYTPGAVVGKMLRNQTEYQQGFRMTDNSIVNFATLGKNAEQFGWRSSTSGVGISDLGRMLADSRGFSRCMVRRAFTAVCRRPPLVAEESLVRSLADQFETDGYHMRRMFENVAVQQQCVQ